MPDIIHILERIAGELRDRSKIWDYKTFQWTTDMNKSELAEIITKIIEENRRG